MSLRRHSTQEIDAMMASCYVPQSASAAAIQSAPQAFSASVASEKASALFNLEHSTHSDRSGWSCTVLDFGHVLELRAVFISDTLRRRRSGKITSERVTSCYEDPEKLAWRIRRSQRLCRWRALCLQADAMWTLTKRGKFETVDEAQAALARWVRLIRKWSSKPFDYVAVPEQHEDGRWHVHVAVRGFWAIGMLRKLWYRALGGTGKEAAAETPGSVNVKSFQGARGACVVARYISKYMAKSFSVVGNSRKCFWCSKGLGPLSVVRTFYPVILSRDPVIELRAKLEAFRPGKYEVFEWNFAGTSGFIIKTKGS